MTAQDPDDVVDFSGRVDSYVGELVTVTVSDHDGHTDVLIVELAARDAGELPLVFETSRAEARDLIAGLVAVL